MKNDITYEEIEEQYEQAHVYLTLADAGDLIDQRGIKQFLFDVLPFVNNPENEFYIDKMLKT